MERNANEADWFRKAAEIVPDAVPKLLAEDRDAGMFAMAYLDPETNPLWKKELRDGRVAPGFAASVGTTLGKIHAATANDDIVAERFATDEIFHAIRIEPYLLRTAETCPDVAPRLKALARVTAETRRVLVHGDVSPKNILNGARGPVFLDAEWYGDPAFDLAFCLNHLLPGYGNRPISPPISPAMMRSWLPIWNIFTGSRSQFWKPARRRFCPDY